MDQKNNKRCVVYWNNYGNQISQIKNKFEASTDIRCIQNVTHSKEDQPETMQQPSQEETMQVKATQTAPCLDKDETDHSNVNCL
uniref:Uncharacterized protein n=1 Tax=Romanomermis culicivorax TaxID=13658 RepID=A0A915I2W0_ROMCU